MLKLLSVFFLVTTFAHANDLSAYQAFGGKAGLVKVVDATLLNILSDEKLSPFFEKIDQPNFKAKLVEQLCVELSGPCTYTGQNMKRAHKGQDIKSSHFYGLVEALQKAMNQNKIPQRAQNKLLAKLAPMHKDIITK